MHGCAVCRRFLGNRVTATTDKETEVNHQAEDATRGAVDRRGGWSPRAVDDRHRPMIASWASSLLVTATDATRRRQSQDLAALFDPRNCSDERMMELGLKTGWLQQHGRICTDTKHSTETPRLCRSVTDSCGVLRADPRLVWTALNWVYRMGKFQEYWLTDVE